MTRGKLLVAAAMVAALAACSGGGETRRGTGSTPSLSPGATGLGTAGTGGPTARSTSGGTSDPSPNPSKSGKETGPSITGVEGSVLVHPDCYPQCDIPSYTLRDATVTARNTQGRVVKTAKTNSSGAYQMVISAGRYTLTVTGGNAPTWNGAAVEDCRAKTVTVVSGRLADGTLECRYSTQGDG